MKYCKNTEYFKNQGLGLEFECSDNENVELSEEEIQSLNLKDLDYFDTVFHQTLKLWCVEEYDEKEEETNIIGYYKED